MLKAPFPWFGGKSRAAELIWTRFGCDVKNYVEPFAGSLAVLLSAPHDGQIVETVNDLDGFITNFWRAIQASPDEVWLHADWPVSEADLHARHIWLVNQRETLTSKLIGDPTFFDTKIAGWWVWGICLWIGGGWCSGEGPWQTDGTHLINIRGGNAEIGVGGVKRKLPELLNTRGIQRRRPALDTGRGIKKQVPHLSTAGHGVHSLEYGGSNMFQPLAQRLRKVRVCCGNWDRVLTATPTVAHGLTAVLLDPPYSSETNRYMGCYAVESGTVAHDVREWAAANGNNPLLRIALCGYEGEHDELEQLGWTVETWVSNGGYGAGKGNQADANKFRERIWFSPHCLQPEQELTLFGIA